MPYGGPIASPTEIGKARAMAHHAIAHAETACLPQQNAAEVVHQILLLAFHNEKAVGQQSTEDQSHLLAPRMDGLREFALELLERERLEPVKLLENISDRWRGERIYPKFFPRMIRRASGFFLREGRKLAGDGKEKRPSICNDRTHDRDGGIHCF